MVVAHPCVVTVCWGVMKEFRLGPCCPCVERKTSVQPLTLRRNKPKRSALWKHGGCSTSSSIITAVGNGHCLGDDFLRAGTLQVFLRCHFYIFFIRKSNIWNFLFRSVYHITHWPHLNTHKLYAFYWDFKVLTKLFGFTYLTLHRLLYYNVTWSSFQNLDYMLLTFRLQYYF